MASSAINNLAPTFRTAITSILEMERQPVKRMQAERDAVSLRRAVYNDLKSNLDALQSAVRALISSQADYALNLGRKASVVPVAAGTTVLSATAAAGAAFGEYDLQVIALAKAQSWATQPFAGAGQPLGKSGKFWLVPEGSAEVTAAPGGLLAGAHPAAVLDGLRELGSGEYSLETREKDGVRQFRLLDADGSPVAISDRVAGGKSTTAEWQTVPQGSYNTGRGFTIDFDSAGSLASTSITYRAAGLSIVIAAGDSLVDIAARINAVAQPEGRDFKASVVGRQLVLGAQNTGQHHGLQFVDQAGLGFMDNPLQPAQDAQLLVNGLSIFRSKNSSLADIIPGVTLNLAADAEGKTARLSITADLAGARKAVDGMVSKFNTALTHLTQKMAISSQTEGEKTTYTRGPLTGDLLLRGLRLDLVAGFAANVSSSGSFKNLSEIGLNLDKDFKLGLDGAKFEAALQADPAGLGALLDGALGGIDTLLGRYTGASGSLQGSLKSSDDSLKQIDERIQRFNQRLTRREEVLVQQYASMQAQLVLLNNQARMFGLTGSNLDQYG